MESEREVWKRNGRRREGKDGDGTRGRVQREGNEKYREEHAQRGNECVVCKRCSNLLFPALYNQSPATAYITHSAYGA